MRGLNLRALLFPATPHIDDQEGRTDGDSAIRDIESGEIMIVRIYFDEVRDGPAYNAVEKIAHGAAEDQRKADAEDPVGSLFARGPKEDPGDQRQHSRRESDQDQAAQRTRGVGEQAEGDSRVLSVDDVEEAGNDAVCLPERHVGFDEPFRDAVEDEDSSGDHERGESIDHPMLLIMTVDDLRSVTPVAHRIYAGAFAA